MRRWQALIIAAAALTLHGPARGDAEKGLKEAVGEINATFAKARCSETRAEVPEIA